MPFEIEMKRIVRQVRPGLMGVNSRPSRNLAVVIDDMKSSQKWLQQLRGEAVPYLCTQDFVPALTESGLMIESGFFAEIFRKVEYKFLPRLTDERDFLAFLRRLFDAAGGGDWIVRVDPEKVAEFLALMIPDGQQLVSDVGPQLFQSLEILGLRLSYVGVEPEVFSRLKERPELQHAFLNVQHELHKLLGDDGYGNVANVYSCVRLCREAANYIRAKRDREGISLGLTFRLMRIQELANRMEEILAVLETIVDKWSPVPITELLMSIMVNETRRFELRAFVEQNIELLAFQITEHTGRTGEHYITSTRSEYRDMFRSAAIGGAVVAIIVIFKVLISLLPLAPVPQGVSYSILYAAGFILLHTLGGTLASKQPAMTASRIAAALDEAKSSEQAMGNLTELIVRTMRSQLIALLGNYLIAFPVAFLLCAPLRFWHFSPIPPDKAEYLLSDLHPWHSLALIHAAIAGCCLFTAGIVAGAADNWFVFNRVGARLQNAVFLRRIVKSHNLKKAIRFIENNIGFWVGNISLGFFLGCMGTVGIILGLPLNIRHVTFSSGQLGVALANLPGGDVQWSTIALTAVTIFCIGLINLGTSFSLTLYMTMKSRRIRFSQTRELLRLCLARLRKKPLDFFFPPAEPKGALE